MIGLSPERIAEEAGAEVVRAGEAEGPRRVVVDSREAGPGDLFVGLRGEHDDGGGYAVGALDAGAWGVIVRPERSARLDAGWVLSVADPLASLQRLARAWRRELDRPVVGITGSTGKTSTKDICAALLGERVHASPENYNTEVGLPLAILSAPADCEVVVLEMAMRGPGQIADLGAIAEPDVAVITNVGPVHLELLGSVEAIADAKAEILRGLREGGTAVIPVDAPEFDPHLAGISTLRFGAGGDVEAREASSGVSWTDALIATPAGELRFRFPFAERHHLSNALAAIAAGTALGVSLDGMSQRAAGIVFSRLRGELVRLGEGIVLVNDCYNANPMSMRAALDHLASLGTARRLIAVLGEMRELGPDAERFHREVGEHARAVGVEVVIGVGEPASAYRPDELVPDSRAAAARLSELVRPGDAILVKGSRAVALEGVAEELLRRRPDGDRSAGTPPEGAGG
jgi:UDP-N-acetylmuramoyl-tripeptide--D-alanyl-D-alanine ligase